MMDSTHLSVCRRSRSQSGLTLLELMVSMSIGLVLLAGMGAVYLSSKQTYRLQQDNARLQESGRYALDLIGRSLRQAGLGAPIDSTAQMPADCGRSSATCVAITGTDDSVNGTSSDTVSVQFYAHVDEENPLGSGILGGRDCAGGFAPVGTLLTNTYALAETELKCTGSVGGEVTLLSGIEDFQVLYGVDNNDDESANTYVSTPANWAHVVTARLCVLVRSPYSTAVAARQRLLNCGGILGSLAGSAAFLSVGDSHLRRTFAATFNLRNRITRLP